LITDPAASRISRTVRTGLWNASITAEIAGSRARHGVSTNSVTPGAG
jgi:hypothetical protein